MGSAAALLGGPQWAFAAVVSFVVGRALVLLAVAGVGAQLVPNSSDARWRRLDVLVGSLFLAAAFYLYRVASRQVVTALPDEPGGPLP